MRFEQEVEIAEIAFSPDAAVEAYHLPSRAILSKGQPRTRRSGMTQRWEYKRMMQVAEGTPSIPGTANSWD